MLLATAAVVEPTGTTNYTYGTLDRLMSVVGRYDPMGNRLSDDAGGHVHNLRL